MCLCVPILLNFEAFLGDFALFGGCIVLHFCDTDTYINTLLLALLLRKERYTSNKNVVRRRSFSGAERDIIGCVFFFCFCGVVKNDEFDERPKDESLVLVVFFFFFFFGLDKDQNVVGFLLLLILLRNADAFLENACEW